MLIKGIFDPYVLWPLTIGTWGHPSPLRHSGVLIGWSQRKEYLPSQQIIVSDPFFSTITQSMLILFFCKYFTLKFLFINWENLTKTYTNLHWIYEEKQPGKSGWFYRPVFQLHKNILKYNHTPKVLALSYTFLRIWCSNHGHLALIFKSTYICCLY